LGGKRRALRAVASSVACVCAGACGSSAHVGAQLFRQPAVLVGPAPVDATPPVDTEPPAPVPVRSGVERTPVAYRPVARSTAAPRRRPVEDTLFTIEIPKLGLNAKVHEGQSAAVLARGPGHLPGSALPGETGNVVVPGHRTVGPHPFLDIDQLRQGDDIILTDSDGRFVYEMTGSAIVSHDDIEVTDPTPNPTATIYACHPKGSDRQRYVVFAKLVSPPLPSRPSSTDSQPGPQGGAPPANDSASPPPQDASPPPSCGLIPCVHR